MEKSDRKCVADIDFFEDLTGKISFSKNETAEEIGARIRRIRKEKDLSLAELSHMTGFAPELLSKIESDEVQPQLGMIIKLSKALDSAFGRLVSGVGDRIYAITRKDEQKNVARSSTQSGRKKAYTYKSLASEVKGRHMEALIVQLEEIAEEEMSVHDGEEFIYVLNGEVDLQIGDDAFVLETGDSAYYLSTTPHLIRAKTGQATIVAVIYDR